MERERTNAILLASPVDANRKEDIEHLKRLIAG
jgi:hypothetical protein